MEHNLVCVTLFRLFDSSLNCNIINYMHSSQKSHWNHSESTWQVNLLYIPVKVIELKLIISKLFSNKFWSDWTELQSRKNNLLSFWMNPVKIYIWEFKNYFCTTPTTWFKVAHYSHKRLSKNWTWINMNCINTPTYTNKRHNKLV